jgi:hypothetical protein
MTTVQFNCVVFWSGETGYRARNSAFPGMEGQGPNPASAALDLVELLAARLGDSPCPIDTEFQQVTLIQGEVSFSLFSEN